VLTGDSLFVGDAARPDLAVDALDGAEGLFHSLHRLVALGDGVEVYPGHVAGSLCGAAMSSKPSTTIGFERRFNHALTESYQDFMASAGGPQPPRPPNMEAIVELNRGPLFGACEPPAHVEAAADAVVLDVREVDAYAAGHRPGSVNVPVSGSSFGTKTAFVLPDRRIHLDARDEAEAQLAAQRLWAVGMFDLDGWSEAGGAERMESLSIEEVEQLLSADAIQLLDVRETDERDREFIPGSTHLPYRTVRQAAENGLCGAKPIVTICESGARAAVAASVLQSVGVDARPVLHGGIATWHGERCSFRRCGS
jgi:rhodanese-related sulfurtransferase